MEPLPRQVREMHHHAIVALNWNTVISNLMSVYTGANHRSNAENVIDDKTILALCEQALRPIESWLPYQKLVDVKQAVERVDEQVLNFLGSLIATPTVIADAGECAAQRLQKSVDCWTTEYVTLPALGYPRQYLRFNRSLPDGTDWLRVPHPNSEYSRAMAQSLALIDKGRFTSALIVTAPELQGIDTRDRPAGVGLKLAKQVKLVQATFMLYACQALLGCIRAQTPLRDGSLNMAHIVEPTSEPVLAAFEEAANWLLEQPVHPLISAAADAVSGVTCETYFGTTPLMFRLVSGPITIGDAIAEDGDPCASTSTLRRRVVDEAFEGFNDELPTGVRLGCQYDTWGAGANSPSAQLQSNSLAINVIRAYRLLRSATELTNMWPAIASSLGWTDIPLEPDQIQFAAASFVLTDGEMFSAPRGQGSAAAAVVAGLKPGLSLGNVAAQGLGIRYFEAFNAKEGSERIQWSALPVRGHAANIGAGGYQYERYAQPAGMSMGATDAGIAYAFDTRDPLAKRVINHYARQASRYVRYLYLRIVSQPDIGVIQTDWDAEGVAPDYAAATTNWATAWNGEMVFADKSHYLISKRKDGFKLRVPVKMALASELALYDTGGVFVELHSRDGNAIAGAPFVLTGTGEDIQRIVDIMPTMDRVGLPSLKGLETSEGQSLAAEGGQLLAKVVGS